MKNKDTYKYKIFWIVEWFLTYLLKLIKSRKLLKICRFWIKLGPFTQNYELFRGDLKSLRHRSYMKDIVKPKSQNSKFRSPILKWIWKYCQIQRYEVDFIVESAQYCQWILSPGLNYCHSSWLLNYKHIQHTFPVVYHLQNWSWLTRLW